jgi:hypothetical protein
MSASEFRWPDGLADLPGGWALAVGAVLAADAILALANLTQAGKRTVRRVQRRDGSSDPAFRRTLSVLFGPAVRIEVVRYDPPRWPQLIRLNNRTYRTLLLVDGRVALTGGVGISDARRACT